MTGSETTQKIRTVPATTAKMAPQRTSVTARSAAAGPPAPNPAPAPETAPVYVSAMDIRAHHPRPEARRHRVTLQTPHPHQD